MKLEKEQGRCTYLLVLSQPLYTTCSTEYIFIYTAIVQPISTKTITQAFKIPNSHKSSEKYSFNPCTCTQLGHQVLHSSNDVSGRDTIYVHENSSWSTAGDPGHKEATDLRSWLLRQSTSHSLTKTACRQGTERKIEGNTMLGKCRQLLYMVDCTILKIHKTFTFSTC